MMLDSEIATVTGMIKSITPEYIDATELANIDLNEKNVVQILKFDINKVPSNINFHNLLIGRFEGEIEKCVTNEHGKYTFEDLLRFAYIFRAIKQFRLSITTHSVERIRNLRKILHLKYYLELFLCLKEKFIKYYHELNIEKYTEIGAICAVNLSITKLKTINILYGEIHTDIEKVFIV
jgi:hypothetical protein